MKHNCLLPLPLSSCYACCVCCASCAFRSDASKSASGSLPTRFMHSAGANCFTPIIQHLLCVFSCFCTMLAPVYSATHLHWFPMELERGYSNNNCLLAMPPPPCYAAHVCWVFCVLSFSAFDAASKAVVGVLRALQHVFATLLLGRSAFMVHEPCLHPCTPPHILNGCRRVGNREGGNIQRNGSTTPSLSFKLNTPRIFVCVSVFFLLLALHRCPPHRLMSQPPACPMGQSEEKDQGPAGQGILVDELHNVSAVPGSWVCG